MPFLEYAQVIGTTRTKQGTGIIANCSTEGANKDFPIWDIFKEFPISQSFLNGFG
jgi:hypothetical protein